MGSSFGERLKQERISRNLTQGELGGALYSSTYVSLLESAHREPTAEIIQALAAQLHKTRPSTSAESEATDSSENECLRLSLCASQSWDTRDYSSAAVQAQAAAGLAIAANEPLAWWNLMFLAIHALLREGENDAAIAALEPLLIHPVTTGSDALALRAHQVMAAALLALGNLPEAIAHATASADIGSGDSAEEFNAYLMALQTLIGALTEAGRLDEAWTHALALADSITAETPAQVAGEIHWVVGNVAFIRHDTRTGLEHHGKAGRLLSPTEDLSRWAQFNKATAWVRLMASVVEPETLEAIERSELAHSVVGASPAEALEVALLRARWNFLSGDVEQALELLSSIEAQTDQLAPHIAGDTALLLGDVLRASERFDEAKSAYRLAQERYNQAGACDRAAIAAEHLAAI